MQRCSTTSPNINYKKEAGGSWAQALSTILSANNARVPMPEAMADELMHAGAPGSRDGFTMFPTTAPQRSATNRYRYVEGLIIPLDTESEWSEEDEEEFEGSLVESDTYDSEVQRVIASTLPTPSPTSHYREEPDKEPEIPSSASSEPEGDVPEESWLADVYLWELDDW